MKQFEDVDSYITEFPPATQLLLKKLRSCILKTAPNAIEHISYGMPAYKLNGPLIYFAAYSKHIGLYPTGSGIVQFKEQLSAYKLSKGTIQFPLDKALPIDLIAKLVKFRVTENLAKAQAKKK